MGNGRTVTTCCKAQEHPQYSRSRNRTVSLREIAGKPELMKFPNKWGFGSQQRSQECAGIDRTAPGDGLSVTTWQIPTELNTLHGVVGLQGGCRRKLELLYQQRLPISRNLFAYQQELFLLHFSFAYQQVSISSLSAAVTLLKHLSSAYHQVLSSGSIISRYTFRLPISRFLSSAYQQPLHLSLALFPTPG